MEKKISIESHLFKPPIITYNLITSQSVDVMVSYSIS